MRLVPVVLGVLFGCAREAAIAPDPAPAHEAGAVEEPSVVGATTLVRAFDTDRVAAHARYGLSTDDASVRPPFLVTGPLIGLDELYSGLDRVRFGDAERGFAACYVPVITPAMKRWKVGRTVVVRTHGVYSYSPGHVLLECEFVQPDPNGPVPASTL